MLLKQRKGEQDHLNILIKDWLVGKKDLIGIQIGCYQGESTEMFINSGVFTTFYAIDPWQPGYDQSDLASSIDIYKAEIKFDERFKDNQIVKKIKLKSSDAINMFKDKTIDFVYIDGCHQYDNVIEDIKNYFPKVKDNGIIAGHDYNWKGVKRAVEEYFKKDPQVYGDTSWIYSVKEIQQ